MKTPFKFTPSRFVRLFALTALAANVVMPANATVSIPDTPLVTGVTVPPNLMVLFDNSGSMNREYVPEATSTGTFSDTSGLSSTYLYVSFRASNANGQWYNPAATYTPPVNWDGSSFPSYSLQVAVDNGFGAYIGAGTASVCIVNKAASSGSPNGWPSGYAGFTSTSSGSTPTNSNGGFYFYGSTGAAIRSGTSLNVGSATCPSAAAGTVATPAFYVLTSGASASTLSNYTLYEFRLNSSNGLEARKSVAGTTTYTNITDSSPGACGSAFCWTTSSGTVIARTVAQEAANLANWHAYYANRFLMAKSSLSRAFSTLGRNYRVGFANIWDSFSSMYKIPVGSDGGLFENLTTPTTTTNRQDWFTRVFSQSGNSSTPTRAALDMIGQYFKDSTSSGPYGPGTGNAQLSCRMNFTILTTDGYWNESPYGSGRTTSDPAPSTLPLNASNLAGTAISGPNDPTYTYSPAHPYSSGFSTPVSQTSPTLADVAMYYWKTDLRTDMTNNVPSSSLDPAFWQHMVTFAVSIGASGSLTPNATTLQAITNGTTAWPQPKNNDTTGIDDLWRATVNSRGSFVVAIDPNAFYKALKAALAAVQARGGSMSNIAATSTTVSTSAYVFKASYTSGTWTGDLKAYYLTSSGGISTTSPWSPNSAAQQIPAAASRKIYYKPASSASTLSFDTTNILAADLTTIGGADVVNYIRGDQSKEASNGGAFRTRTSLLGDIVDSSPVYDSTTGTVYVAANDGMIHAFNSTTGVERFAIVPSTILYKLKDLTSTEYAHEFFVDGDLVLYSTSTQTILVASLGRGGRALMAIDVTNIQNSGVTPKVLWEFSNTDLGYVLARPMVAKTNDSSHVYAVIAGNGLNSGSDKAMLFAIDLLTGTLMTKIDTQVASSNGLWRPAGIDTDRNGTVDFVYAGDQNGDLWKFDLTSTSSTAWKSALMSGSVPTPLFVAKDSSGNLQPITGGIALGVSTQTDTYGRRFVFFGTGSYVTAADSSSLAIQSWYGIIDDNVAVTGRSQLTQRTIATDTPATATTLETRQVSTPAAGDMIGKHGWYLDLVYQSNPDGERILNTPMFLGSAVLAVTSMVPTSTDACTPGGDGWLYVVDPYTGGLLSQSIFSSYTNAISGVKLGIGLLSQGLPMKIDLTHGSMLTCGASGNCTNTPFTLPKMTGRTTWREIITQ